MEAIIYVFGHSTCFNNWWFRTVATLRSIDNLYHDLNDKNDSSDDDHDDFETPPPPLRLSPRNVPIPHVCGQMNKGN